MSSNFSNGIIICYGRVRVDNYGQPVSGEIIWPIAFTGYPSFVATGNDAGDIITASKSNPISITYIIWERIPELQAKNMFDWMSMGY